MRNLSGKTAFVTGGSGGLGVEISKALAAQGAHVTIFARRQESLNEAKNQITAMRLNANQEVHAVSLDLANSSQVGMVFMSQERLPDMLFCVAGGSMSLYGLLADIPAEDLETCMKNNYFTSAYAAQSVLKMWVEDDKNVKTSRSVSRPRQIVFINSAAAFLGVPGYVAYASSKCALRALADTLRMEALRYSSSASTYTVHCAFPSNFNTQAFLEGLERKPELTKQIEGTTGSVEDVAKRFPSATTVAHRILVAVERGDFAICDDSIESALLFANMIGPSPKRGLGIVDSLFAVIVGFIIWPLLRRRWDAVCKRSEN